MKKKTYTKSLKPEAIIYALRKSGFIHSNVISLCAINQLCDEVQILYTKL